LLVFAAVTAAACSRSVAAPQNPASALPDAYDDYYGVYLSGHKVGWMRSQLQVGATIEASVELNAKVGGMGQISDVSLMEQRSYDPKLGRLSHFSFVQKASTGEVRVSGEARGDKLHIRIVAAQTTSESDVPNEERVEDLLTTTRLARQATVGQSEKSVHFDPSLQRVLHIEDTVRAVETRMFDGIETKVVKIDENYPELGVVETSWLNVTGKVLETRVGGFFVARLEQPETAKRLDYEHDILVSAVVGLPEPLTHQEKLTHLNLVMTGFGEQVPPSSDRQKVRVQDDGVHLDLSRDVLPPVTHFAISTAPSHDPDLAATPFVQSDAPEIRAAAREAVGDATDAFTASSRLEHFVYKHIRNEYVPAYSNSLEALRTARGDCTEHSVLYVGLARAVGLPSRMAVGIAYWAPAGGFGWHAWDEVKIAGKWVAVDPTWDQPIADATHIKLAAGDPAEQARIVMLLGQLEVASEQHTWAP